MMQKNHQKLLENLVDKQIISKEVSEKIKKKSEEEGLPIDELLISEKLISEKKLVEEKSAIFNIPIADIVGQEVPKKILRLIPYEVAQNYQMVPIAKKGNEIHIGMVDPQNFKAIEVVEFLSQKANLSVKYFIITTESLKYALRQYQVLGEEVKEALSVLDDEAKISSSSPQAPEDMEEVIKSAPVSKMVLVIIRHAIDGRASDIHIEPSIKETKVRYRIDGMLRTSLVLPKYIHAAVVARIKVLANLKLDESRKPQDGRIRLSIEGRDIDFRVSTLPLFEGEKVVMRILDTQATAPTLLELGFNSVHIEMIHESIKRPNGLMLLTGPTGSGKTTTLYTALTLLNKDGYNIVTLEDPIEYYIAGVNQSQVNPEIGYNFASGLRAILRQDPNIVMVGEIRDHETTQLVVHASLTGHMILSTLHTNDAVGAIPRLIDLGAEFFLLSSVLNLIIAQRLARKICPDCKEETKIPDAVLKKISDKLAAIPEIYKKEIDPSNLKFYKGAGCSHCAGMGYQGRIAVAEVIKVSPEIRDIINKGADVNEIKKALEKQSFIDLVQDALVKALKGVTTVDEVMRVSQLT